MSLSPSEFPLANPDKKLDATARRTRLREFQSQLTERMQAARSGTEAQVNQLGVTIGQTRWLLDLQEASEIVAVGTMTKVPLTQDWYLGLTNIRGNLINIIDLARFQGGAMTTIDQDSRIVAFAPALAFNSGLLVSRVLGLRNVAEMTLEPATEEGGLVASRSAGRYRDRDAQLWTQLNLSLIAQDPRFLHVGL